MSDLKELKQLLLEAPKGHIDDVALDSIREWDDEPKALQILRTLDLCVQAGLSSGFVIGVLESILEVTMSNENTTYEKLTEKAVWRS